MKIQKKIYLFWGRGVGVGSVDGDQGRCERRSKIFVKNKKMGGGGSGGGVRVDENQELKFLWKFKEKKVWGGGRIWSGGFEFWGVRVDVNREVKYL